MSSSNNSSVSSGTFSEATRLETKRLAGNKCWACSNLHVEIAHVVAISDTQVDSLLCQTLSSTNEV